MADPGARPGIWALLSLRNSRGLVHRRRFFGLAVAIALVYALIAMVVGSMLQVFSPPAHLASYWVVLTAGSPWWDYPALLAVNPYFILALPFLPTVFMALTSAGVGLGMSVAVFLTIGLLRQRKTSAARPAAVGTAVGLTPALIALVTLGACCSTTAAATAGIGLTAQATGTSTSALLLNDWYLGVFQLVILYVALLAQEQLLTVYGALVPSAGVTGLVDTAPPPLNRRFVVGGILRVLLLAAGVTWNLTMLGQWLSINPVSATAGEWTSWILQHQLVSSAAIVAALVPMSVYRGFIQWASSRPGVLLRALLVVGGVSLAIGVPPPLAAAGWHGLVNEILGAAGVSVNWGAVAPGQAMSGTLLLRWATQYALLGGFAIALGLRPAAALRPILWTLPGASSKPTTSEGSDGTPGPRPISEGRLAFTPESQR
jgi:hypothetical protein